MFPVYSPLSTALLTTYQAVDCSAKHPPPTCAIVSTNFVENTEQSRQWARDNWHSISTKKAEYLHKWAAKSPAEKAEVTLTVNDGI
jgi:hypothetical protein